MIRGLPHSRNTIPFRMRITTAAIQNPMRVLKGVRAESPLSDFPVDGEVRAGFSGIGYGNEKVFSSSVPIQSRDPIHVRRTPAEAVKEHLSQTSDARGQPNDQKTLSVRSRQKSRPFFHCERIPFSSITTGLPEKVIGICSLIPAHHTARVPRSRRPFLPQSRRENRGARAGSAAQA